MVVYSIKDIEKLSGVKAHTLRIWEKRYNLVNPRRTKTNIRYYTDEDLRHILNVCFLYRRGYKISKIAKMDKETLKQEVSSHSKLDLSFEDQIDALLLFVMELDSYNFNQILDQHISQKGMEETMSSVIYPVLDKLSMAWLAGSFTYVHEAFVIQIIKSKILASIEALDDLADYSNKYVIYLADQEQQELSLLFFHYLLKKNGNRVINLGTGINLSDVGFSINAVQPDYVFTIINEGNTSIPLENYTEQISSQLGDATLLLTGYHVIVSDHLNWPDNVVRLSSLMEALNFVNDAKNKRKAS